MASPAKEWMLGLPEHKELVTLEQVSRLITGGQLRETDLVKKLGEPWRAANEVPDLEGLFRARSRDPKAAPVRSAREEAAAPEPSEVTETAIPAVPDPGEMADEKTDVTPAVPPPRARPKTEVRKKTEPVPKIDRPAAPKAEPRKKTEPVPKVEARPAVISKSEVAPPRKSRFPRLGSLKGEAKAETEKPEAAAGAPPEPEKEEKAATPTPRRPVRVVPRLEPMTPKYFSPVDLLRSASHAFDPKKLLLAAVVLVPLMVFWSLCWHFATPDKSAAVRSVFRLLSTGSFVFGAAFILTALAYITRRQLEAARYAVPDVLAFAGSNVVTAVVYPVLVLIPSLLALLALWLIGLLHDKVSATAVEAGFIVPMIFAFLAVAGALLYQLASMYVPSAAAIEGTDLKGSIQAVWGHTRHQQGRVVLHWLIVTVAVGVISLVSVGLATVALHLPDLVWEQRVGWNGNLGVLLALYAGLAYGLGLTLPFSLLSTLGALSYVSLRHPVAAQLPLSPPDETGHGEFVPPPPLSPMEATQPAEARPPSGLAAPAAGATTAPPSAESKPPAPAETPPA